MLFRSYSRRLLAPQSWVRRSLRDDKWHPEGVTRWGANAVEIETMRYRPRRELTTVLGAYDLIQVVSGSPALAAAVAGAGVPIVLQAASTVVWERRHRLQEETGLVGSWRAGMTSLTARVERTAIRFADAVLVDNSAMVEYVRACGQRRVIKAPPGVDTALFSPSPHGWRPQGHLLSVCRLDDPRKGLDRMLRAYARMVVRDPGVPNLVLAGLNDLPASTYRLVADLGLRDRVKVRPNLSQDELLALYRGASVFLQASYEEGFGMSMVEAMACGLPSVCTETAGAREIAVDGVTGWLVPQLDGPRLADVFADRVLQVVQGDDAGLMGDRARERCQTIFSTDVTLRRYTDLYRSLLARCPTVTTASAGIAE